MIVVDTSVWSHAFRRVGRRADVLKSNAARILEELIASKEPVAIPGIVMQELLSGVRIAAQFDRLREDLRSFPVLLAD